MLRFTYYIDGEDVERKEEFDGWESLVTRVADLIDKEIVYMWNDGYETLGGRLDDGKLPGDLFVIEDNGELLINRSRLLRTLELFDQLTAIHDILYDTTCTFWEITGITYK